MHGKNTRFTGRKKFLIHSENDKRKLDPNVVADNVKLSKHQIDICRKSDCFAPISKTPLDVHDKIVETHAWSELLLWHRYHDMKSKANLIDYACNENEKKLKLSHLFDILPKTFVNLK